jgi:hypothetical protein
MNRCTKHPRAVTVGSHPHEEATSGKPAGKQQRPAAQRSSAVDAGSQQGAVLTGDKMCGSSAVRWAGSGEEEEEEIVRLPWRGQCGRRAAAARALCALCLLRCWLYGYAKDYRTGSPVRF